MLILRTYRTIMFFSADFFFMFVGALVNLFFVPMGERLRAKAQAVLTMLWCKCICFILGIHVAKSGQRRKRCGFTVCNHTSYVDVFVMGSQRPTSFLAKHDVRGWPIIGWLAYLGGTVFVNRDSKRAALDAMKEIERKVDWGITVIIFPEGTTSSGRLVRTFKSTFFKIPVTRNLGVRPASIRYSSSVLDSIAWHGGEKHIVPHFWHLAGFSRINASVYFGHSLHASAEWGSAVAARKRLCELAYESVVAGLETKKHRHQGGSYGQ
jgi:1-acyl-sn-glycerol-3-phosphate acyltransferase